MSFSETKLFIKKLGAPPPTIKRERERELMLSTPFPWARKGLTKEGIQNSLEEGRYTEVNKSLSGRYTTAQAAQGKVGVQRLS